MSLLARLRSWSRRSTSSHGARRRARKQRPLLEVLEERTLLDGGLGTELTPPDMGTGTTGVTGPFSDPDAGTLPGNNVSPDAPSAPPAVDYSGLVQRLYGDLLHRVPSAIDTPYWVSQLQAGLGRDHVAREFAQSPEFKGLMIHRDYQALLGRTAEPEGVNYWMSRLAKGGTEEQMLAEILASPEFYQLQGQAERDTVVASGPKGAKPAPHRKQLDNDTNWLTGLYGLTIGRLPDAGGLDYWKHNLQQGESRLAIAQAIANSGEADALKVGDMYRTLLRRYADAQGIQFWSQQMESGLSMAQVSAVIAGSVEYSVGIAGAPLAPFAWDRSDLKSAVATSAENQPDRLKIGAESTEGSFHIDGTGEPGATIIVSVDGIPSQREVVDRTGAWSASLPSFYTSGTHIVSVYPGFGAVSPFSGGDSKPSSGNGGGGNGGGGGGGSGNGSSSGSFTFGSGSSSQSGTHPRIANVNISNTSTTNVAEEAIAVDPSNPQRVFAAGIAVDLAAGQWVGYSTDGGATFASRLAADGSDGLTKGSSDPATVFDRFGNLYWAYLDDPGGIDKAILNISTDGGQTFKQLAAFTRSGSSGIADQPALAFGADTIWIMFTDAGLNPSTIQAAGARVTGLGLVGAFSALQAAPGSDNGNFNDIAVGPNGQVMVTYEVDPSSGGEGPNAMIQVNVDPDGIGGAGFSQASVAAITNCGAIDAIPAQPGPFNVGGRTIDAEPGLAWDKSGGPNNGRVYLVYVDEMPDESNDMNIELIHSDDNGSSWSSPLRVNDDTTKNSQFHCRVAVDQTNGSVGVSWYDARNDPGSGPGDLDGAPNTDVEIYAAVSFDGGQTFSQNIQVAESPSNSVKLNPNGVFNFGDYTGLDYNSGVLHPVWADNSTTLPGNDSPKFSLATASVAVASFLPAPAVVATNANLFEPNETSDQATNFGTLFPGSPIAVQGLAVLIHANALPDYDWFRLTPSNAGTFTAAINASNGGLELHVFKVIGSNTLAELARDTTRGPRSKSLSVAVNAGDTVFVEIKGIPLSPGVFGQAAYDLDLSLV